MARLIERQEHILVGCADARDVGQIHVDAVREVRRIYRDRGIDARFHAIRVPGAFVTDDVIADIRRIAYEAEREDTDPALKLSLFVHIQAHGIVEVEGDHAYDLRIADEPALNCGMMAATRVAVRLERLLLQRQPCLRTRRGGEICIRTEADIRTLLREVYGYDGYLAGDWIRSIDDLRTHARSQRSRLERALGADPELRRIDLSVTAGLQDYRRHRHYRTDRDEVVAPFWDELHARIHEEAGRQHEDAARQAVGQAPIAGLIAMPRIEDAPRAVAAEWYARTHGVVDHTHANAVFTLAGSSYDAPHVPFGPYAVAGIYYLLAHLEVTDIVVMGRDHAQVSRMMAKLANDPLVDFILREFSGQLLPLATCEVVSPAASSGSAWD
jgi:hypothetical protein